MVERQEEVNQLLQCLFLPFSRTKGKKRERADQGSEPFKRERSSKTDDGDSVQFKPESLLKSDISKITEKGGLVDSEGVEKLVQLMQSDGSERKLELISRSMLAGVIAATENFDCLSRCVNIGKSVNHLRSHKNLEIQKKARSLVDIWKKRVEAEMNVIDAKSGSTQAISWASRSRLSEVSHGGNQHPVHCQIHFLISRANEICAFTGISGKDGQPRIVMGSTSDLPSTTAREERSSSSSQSHNNSQSCSSDHAKTTVFSGKEDARSSTAGSISVNKMSGGASRHRRSVNGFPGPAVSGGLRETGSSRSSSLHRISASEKLSDSGFTSEKALDVPLAEENSPKLIAKIPNRGRSPAQSDSGGSSHGKVMILKDVLNTSDKGDTSPDAIPEERSTAGEKAGDNVGMNLLASVAAEEMSKSDLISSIDFSAENTRMVEDSFTDDATKSKLSNLNDLAQERSRSAHGAVADGEQGVVSDNSYPWNELDTLYQNRAPVTSLEMGKPLLPIPNGEGNECNSSNLQTICRTIPGDQCQRAAAADSSPYESLESDGEKKNNLNQGLDDCQKHRADPTFSKVVLQTESAACPAQEVKQHMRSRESKMTSREANGTEESPSIVVDDASFPASGKLDRDTKAEISTGLPASITVAAAAKAEPRKVLEMPLGTTSTGLPNVTAGKQGRPLLDFDLNVPDERILEDMASRNSPQEVAPGGLDLDLNRVDEVNDMGQYPESSSRRLDALLPPVKFVFIGWASKDVGTRCWWARRLIRKFTGAQCCHLLLQCPSHLRPSSVPSTLLGLLFPLPSANFAGGSTTCMDSSSSGRLFPAVSSQLLRPSCSNVNLLSTQGLMLLPFQNCSSNIGVDDNRKGVSRGASKDVQPDGGWYFEEEGSPREGGMLRTLGTSNRRCSKDKKYGHSGTLYKSSMHGNVQMWKFSVTFPRQNLFVNGYQLLVRISLPSAMEQLLF
ncbi:protein SUO [Actinidia rufa]|uniref:Protein SUO n=1 Tax=Actinidia rufa TaxID=165716 RepID=A0A7J0GMS3_9ERIC|nr:protein SUO [Actinidia rufa]